MIYSYKLDLFWTTIVFLYQNKSYLLLKIFWNLNEYCNYLQITQIRNYLQKFLKDQKDGLERLRLDEYELKAN